jgi:plastocyanin
MIKKRLNRKIIENVNVSDMVTATVHRRVIIPPKFTNNKLKVNYFNPRFKKILKGEEIEWVNQDSNSHHLKFYEVYDDKVKPLFDLGRMVPNASVKKKFNFNLLRLDYICTLHKNEVGTVIIYPKPEEKMTNVEQFRFLSEIFDIKPPSILSHLRST